MSDMTLPDRLFALAKFGALPFETNFTSEFAVEYTANNPQYPVIALTLYLLFIYYGTKYMEKRPAYDLQYVLAFWNFLLSTFSFIGVCRTVPFAIATFLTLPTYNDLICDNGQRFFEGPTGLWAWLFMWSKLPELIDTVFIVIRKKPLGFLHWYHHVTVLSYCWLAYYQKTGSGIIFLTMNYTVHSIMYAYYCMAALKCVPKSFPSQIITVAQIAQMVAGTHATVVTCLAVYNDEKCDISMEMCVCGVLMYGSYLYLFLEFFVNRYIFKKASKVSSKKSK